MNVFIDLETIPDQSKDAKSRIAETIKPPAQMKKPETIDEWINGKGKYEGVRDKAIENAWLKTSLNGGYGEICSAALEIDNKMYSIGGKEDAILNYIWCVISDKVKSNERVMFIAHKAKFDLPFLWHRSVINGVKPSIDFKPHGRHGIDYYCTMQAWAGYNGMISLDALAKILGVGSKTEGMSGSQVWPEYKAGNIQKIVDYNIDDVRLLRAVYDKLNFIK